MKFELKLSVFILFIYSVFSMPVPSAPGWSEGVIGVLLVVLFFAALLSNNNKLYPRPSLAMIAAVWLMVVPTFFGLVIHQYSFGDFFRDFAPLLFLFLPLLLYPIIKAEPRVWLVVLSNTFIFSGFVLSIRYLLAGEGEVFKDVFVFDTAPINQCPTVIFSAVAGMAFGVLSNKNLAIRAVVFLAGFVSFFTLVMSVMRAQIAIVVLGFVFVFIVCRVKNKYLNISIMLIPVIFVIEFFFGGVGDLFSWVFDMVTMKTDFAGGLANGRDGEAVTVLDYVFSDLLVLLFGDGWGAQMFLPSAADVVRFTHQGFFFYLWKTGVLGLIFVAIYGFGLFSCFFNFRHRFYVVFERNSIYIFSALAAFVIFAGVEMGYKMLSFGFLLCIFLAISFSFECCDD